jgi:hypothetical protein
MSPDEGHHAAAQKMLDDIAIDTTTRGGDPGLKAHAAIAHAVLAVADELQAIRGEVYEIHNELDLIKRK